MLDGNKSAGLSALAIPLSGQRIEILETAWPPAVRNTGAPNA